jgi:NAD-dependent dihydropyrimidine dehydrogenase PreA subunit
VILYEGIGSEPLAPAVRLDVLRSLLEKGFNLTLVRPGGQVTDATSGVLLVLGSFSGQLPNDTHAAGGAVRVLFRDIGGQGGAQVVELVDGVRNDLQLPKPGAWKPWFPVIDYQRCTNCMQCLSFCLFDVYGVAPDGKIQVRNESNCKTDCPACSRVCPEVAILFPKYRQGPINGDEVNSEDVRREAMKIDISALLGGDIYQALRDRSAKAKSRFSKERDDERALKERQRCLVQLGQKLDVPPEVLASLPTLDQIRAKAAEAQARAQEALQRTAPTAR